MQILPITSPQDSIMFLHNYINSLISLSIQIKGGACVIYVVIDKVFGTSLQTVMTYC